MDTYIISYDLEGAKGKAYSEIDKYLDQDKFITVKILTTTWLVKGDGMSCKFIRDGIKSKITTKKYELFVGRLESWEPPYDFAQT